MDKNLWLVIGYAVFTLYTVGIMCLGILLEKKTKIDKTLCRKITHIISAFIWVICYVFFGYSIHWVVLNGVSALLLGFLILGSRFNIFPREDAKKSTGLFYFALSTFIVAVISFLIGEETYMYTGIAYLCLALGDGFAPLVAYALKKHNVKILPSKTLFGSLTVYVVSFLTTLTLSAIFDLGLSPVFALSVGALACLAEFYGFKGLDNIFIDFSVFGYLLLYHYGLVGLPLQAVIIACPLLAWLAIGARAMTADGGVSAFFLFALIGFFSYDFTPIIFMSLLFAISTAVSVVGKRIKRREEGKVGGDHAARRAKQIVAVGLLALISLGVYRYTGIVLFNHLFYLSLTEQFADSMASDIGSLTKRRNINIITFKPCEKGISGGVSLLGTMSALCGCFLLMLLPLALGAVSVYIYFGVCALAFLGTVVDSVAGALFQALYRCASCGKAVEVSTHCGVSGELVKGFRIIDNTAVNYIAGIITCAMGAMLLLI
ncbi:MAG: DUF92 domain-containing protein [Clostridia bacterium]|nr:DUF92 domain-containing protein [Clostridia bacterium]